MSLDVVILISGRGSNMQRIVENQKQGKLHINIKAVISNEPAAAGLNYAEGQGIATRVVNHREFSQRQSFDRALSRCIDSYQPQLVILAGFMRILSAEFVEHYSGRMINIHPSLLPKYPGLHTHRRALEANEKRHGASVHYVTVEVDGGPVIIQGVVPVKPDDNEQSLAARVLIKEHIIYSLAIEWIAQGKLKYHQGRAICEGKELPVVLEWEANADTLS